MKRGERFKKVGSWVLLSLSSPLLPAALFAAILGLDVVQYSHRWAVLMTAVLDEPAHLATAALVLIAVAGVTWLNKHREFVAAALVYSTAIDIDHIPLYARVPYFSVGGRPFTHSLATVVLLFLLAKISRRRRSFVAGAAMGVVLHLFRDIATGPGVPLFWPLTWTSVRAPYRLYLAALAVLAVIAMVRTLTTRRERSQAVDHHGDDEGDLRGHVEPWHRRAR